MKAFLVCMAALLCIHQKLLAQFSENFSDGNFTVSPVWTGNTADWSVNSNLQLQSNNNVANSSFYLSTASTLALTGQWEFYVKLGFNPSGTNYMDVYLTATAADLSLPSTTGYFVRIGNTDDEICLYRKDAGGISVKIIDGLNGILNSSNNSMKIKVTRTASNQWTLFRDQGGTGNNYTSEGQVTDAVYTSSAYFGILVKQSTASFFQLHFVDDIEVKNYVPDITPPAILSLSTVSAKALDVLFDEAVDISSSQLVLNYTVNNAVGNPLAAVRDANNSSLVHLAFANAFPNGSNCQLTVNGVKDIAGNALVNGQAAFIYYDPGRYDIVMDEIMADPSPPVALPNYEFIELKNTSAYPVNIQGWKISDINSTSAGLPSYLLKPDSFLIVCSNTALPAFSFLGNVVGVSGFPSLDNDGDLLSLTNASGKLIHAVRYDISWYRNELKKDGGWSLEMTDTKNPCNGAGNWKASVSTSGGTPGKKNSVDALNADKDDPALLRAYAADSLNIVLVFNEPLDSLQAVANADYTISDGIGNPLSVYAEAPLYDRVHLKLTTPVLQDKVYTVTVRSVTDCAGNTIGSANTAKLGLASAADTFDLVINEILFNPKPGGVDYIELYNRGKKIINLKNIFIANRDAGGTIANIKQLSNEDHLLFPQEYMVITEDPVMVRSQYFTEDTNAFIKTNPLPSFNNDKGDVVILNAQGSILDELRYDAKWHFKLIDDAEGISLERIDYNAPTQNAANWHSAATSAGYGTPGYKNSQYRADAELKGTIRVTPEVFSPDNDGMDDFATISYEFPEPGYVTNISIFDAVGRLVRPLQQSALCGTKGYFRWDGLGQKDQKLPMGIYIIYTEVFNLKGKTKRFKQVVVLARR